MTFLQLSMNLDDLMNDSSTVVHMYERVLNDNFTVRMAEAKSYKIDGRKSFRNPDDVARFMANEIGLKTAADEHAYALCLNNQNALVGLFEISHGGTGECSMSVRETCQKALLLNAAWIILSHNHPGGTCAPSPEDITATKRLEKGLNTRGIGILDHIIIPGNSDKHYSMKAHGDI